MIIVLILSLLSITEGTCQASDQVVTISLFLTSSTRTPKFILEE